MVTNGKNYKWLITPVLTILAFIGGLGAQFVVMKTSIGTVQAAQEKIDSRVAEAERKIQQIEIDKAVSAADIKTIKDNIEEIKRDVKSILNRAK